MKLLHMMLFATVIMISNTAFGMFVRPVRRVIPAHAIIRRPIVRPMIPALRAPRVRVARPALRLVRPALRPVIVRPLFAPAFGPAVFVRRPAFGPALLMRRNPILLGASRRGVNFGFGFNFGF